MTGRPVSVPMTFSDLERRDARGQICRRIILNNARTGWPRTITFGRITDVGEERISRGGGVSHAPTARGSAQAFPNLGVPFYLCTHPLTQNYHICGASQKWWEMGLFLGNSHALAPRGRGAAVPQFWGFLSIYAHTLCRRTTKFDAVTHRGRWLVLGVIHASTIITGQSHAFLKQVRLISRPAW